METGGDIPDFPRADREERNVSPPDLHPWVKALLVPAVLSLLGTYATKVYGSKQDEIKRLEAVEKFLPYFTGKDRPLTDAVVAGQALITIGYPDLATDMMLHVRERVTEKDENKYLQFFDERAEETVPRLCQLSGREGSGWDATEVLGKLIGMSEAARSLVTTMLLRQDTPRIRLLGALRGLRRGTVNQEFVNGDSFVRSWERDGARLALALRTTIERPLIEKESQLAAMESLARLCRYAARPSEPVGDGPQAEVRGYVEKKMRRGGGGWELRLAAVRGYIYGSGNPDGGTEWDKQARAVLLEIAAASGDKDYVVRSLAASVVRGQDDSRFLALLKDANPDERELGVEGVGHCAEKQCEALNEMLPLSAHRSGLREAIVERLPDFRNDERAFAAMKDATRDEDWDVRTAAFRALAKDGRPDARRYIEGVLRGETGYEDAAFYGLSEDCHTEYEDALRKAAKTQRWVKYLGERQKRCEEEKRHWQQ